MTTSRNFTIYFESELTGTTYVKFRFVIVSINLLLFTQSNKNKISQIIFFPEIRKKNY